ncbi:MAG: response regulator [Lysobacterales bacterium]|nr:MAG: response regulator [Xanthomonadales bacterium]
MPHLSSMDSTRRSYIAIIDDDESVCRSMSRLLRAAHLHPVSYPSAEALLTDTKRPKFDCLVLDIQLPGMSGLDLRRRLSAFKDATPVVFITAHDDPEMRSQAEASGCAGYFRKTDSGAEVLAAIRRTIGVDDPERSKSGERPVADLRMSKAPPRKPG